MKFVVSKRVEDATYLVVFKSISSAQRVLEHHRQSVFNSKILLVDDI